MGSGDVSCHTDRDVTARGCLCIFSCPRAEICLTSKFSLSTPHHHTAQQRRTWVCLTAFCHHRRCRWRLTNAPPPRLLWRAVLTGVRMWIFHTGPVVGRSVYVDLDGSASRRPGGWAVVAIGCLLSDGKASRSRRERDIGTTQNFYSFFSCHAYRCTFNMSRSSFMTSI